MKKTKTMTIGVSLLIFTSTNTIADGYERGIPSISANKRSDLLQDGLDAYNKGYYSTAYRLWKPLADQGNTDAQNNLGILYGNGQGVTQDYAEAAGWYIKAANQGYAKSQNSLGVLYETGKGVQQDNEKAAYWYHKAAEQGDANGQNNLGFLYYTNIPQMCGFNFACANKQIAISEDLFG